MFQSWQTAIVKSFCSNNAFFSETQTLPLTADNISVSPTFPLKQECSRWKSSLRILDIKVALRDLINSPSSDDQTLTYMHILSCVLHVLWSRWCMCLYWRLCRTHIIITPYYMKSLFACKLYRNWATKSLISYYYVIVLPSNTVAYAYTSMMSIAFFLLCLGGDITLTYDLTCKVSWPKCEILGQCSFQFHLLIWWNIKCLPCLPWKHHLMKTYNITTLL